MAFTHNGSYCTIKEALGGYKVKAFAMSQAFFESYDISSYFEADKYRGWMNGYFGHVVVINHREKSNINYK